MKKLVPAKLPKSSTATFKVITEILKMGWLDMPNEKSYQGTGAPGRLLEKLLGQKKN